MSTINQTSLETIAINAVAAQTVMELAEAEIVAAVIKSVRYNQSRAAIALGVSRGTMRKLLETHFPGEYIGKTSTAKKGRPA